MKKLIPMLFLALLITACGQDTSVTEAAGTPSDTETVTEAATEEGTEITEEGTEAPATESVTETGATEGPEPLVKYEELSYELEYEDDGFLPFIEGTITNHSDQVIKQISLEGKLHYDNKDYPFTFPMPMIIMPGETSPIGAGRVDVPIDGLDDMEITQVSYIIEEQETRGWIIDYFLREDEYYVKKYPLLYTEDPPVTPEDTPFEITFGDGYPQFSFTNNTDFVVENLAMTFLDVDSNRAYSYEYTFEEGDYPPGETAPGISPNFATFDISENYNPLEWMVKYQNEEGKTVTVSYYYQTDRYEVLAY